MAGKILIVDSVATNRIVFKAALGEAFYRPILAANAETCLRLAASEQPDLILLDLNLPDMAGSTLVEHLRSNPATRDVPILALETGLDEKTRREAFLAGADDVLPKHGGLQPLLARVRNLLRGREGVNSLGAHGAALDLIGLAEASVPFTTPAVVSFLAGPKKDAPNWCKAFAEIMQDRIIFQSREDIFGEPTDAFAQATPDVFVIDATVSGMAESLRLMSELRSRPTTRHSTICVVSHKSTDDLATMAYDQGADDLVDPTISPDEFALRIKALIRRKRREDHLRASVQDGLRMATIDPLTGLHNRRYALPQLAAIADRAQSTSAVFAVMVIDLDRFKSVNDRFGHASGDAVLVEVARRLQSNLRATDLLARIGGEEFLVALPDTSFDEARMAADRLCHAVEEHQIRVGIATNLRVTVSIGLAVSTSIPSTEDSTAIINRADRALLRAKAEGRNKVTISQSAA